jgi:hypothetical protein
MNEMVNRKWTALDARLVFHFTINRRPDDLVPSTVRLSSGSPHSESNRDDHYFNITERQQTPLDCQFDSGCYVRGYLKQQGHFHNDGVDSTGIFADMVFGFVGQNNETHFEGLMVSCPSRGGHMPPPHPPHPPHPPVPPYPPTPAPPSVDPIPYIAGQTGELFPYVYVRRWPKVDPADLLYGFVTYQASSPPSSLFFENLVQAKAQSRDAAQRLAIQFMDGAPPYQGEYLQSVQSLTPQLQGFVHLASKLIGEPPDPLNWSQRVSDALNHYLQRQHLTLDFFTSTAYTGAVDRIWQSYFALTITLGYATDLLVEWGGALWLAHVVRLAVSPTTSMPLVLCELSPLQTSELAQATTLLPSEVFPLPPASQTSSAIGGAGHVDPQGWIEPYAIGDLQMVRQRLVRYGAGEVARIESVMRGERRQVSRKRTLRQVDVLERVQSEAQVLQNDAGDERTSLLEEARKAVAEKTITNTYNKFQTNYGPPTNATLDGSWSRSTKPGVGPGIDDTTRFAREILNKTVNRLTRHVAVSRTHSTMNQTEDEVLSVVDNSAGASSLSAVYRWVNKVYEASVVNYGKRLMMEFMVNRPAARFMAQQHRINDQRLLRPESPLQCGIASFKSIEPSNYAQLMARYQVTDITPPPSAWRFATATLRGGEEKQIPVPTGYCAAQAYVTCLSTPAQATPPTVNVGRQTFSGTAATAPLNGYGEDSTVPVCVAALDVTLSPPSDPQALVNVEIQCVPSPRLLDEWRIAVFTAIWDAYRIQLAEYQSAVQTDAGARGLARSPLAMRQIEQRALKAACTNLLKQRMAQLTGGQACMEGSPPTPSVDLVNEPRVRQFLGETLEWSEMSYSFYASDAEEVGAEADLQDDLFTNFMASEQARVLVPVAPQHVMSFLYFFASGMLWAGPDRLVPANHNDVALIDDLKRTRGDAAKPHVLGLPWEVLVPTSMQIIEEVDVRQCMASAAPIHAEVHHVA